MGGRRRTADNSPERRSAEPFGSGGLSDLIPDLEVMEPIGWGGMGVVYKARQVKLDRLVALKVIRPEVAEHPGFLERFSREARAMARLTHPNVVMIHDFGEVNGLFHLVMQLVEGRNLRRRIDRGPLEPRGALVIALQVCDALQYAHERGVVHRDIKPENVLLDRAGVKIADFGLAKLLLPGTDGGKTATRAFLGTPFYMAPEQLERPKEVDHRVDIFALGVVLYEMLAGVIPYGRYELLSEKVGTEDELDEVVGKALARDPSERYESVAELRHDLAEIAQDHYELPDTAAVLAEALGDETEEEDEEKNTLDWSWLASFAEWFSGRKSRRGGGDDVR
jgi:serine/threonine protein kinase